MPISDEQAVAYLAAEYHVIAPEGRIVLRAFTRSATLNRLHRSFNVSQSAFLTAFNPFSERSDEASNRFRQDQLVAEVRKWWKILPGEGVDPQGRWETEPSVLVLGISRDEALDLGKKHSQNAILVADQEGNTALLACDSQDQAILLRHRGASF